MPKITGLPTNTAPVGADITVIVETATGQTKRILLSDLGQALTVGAVNIDFGGAGSGVWWQEIGRTTLSSAGDTLTASFTAKKYLMFIGNFISSGAIVVALRFNNDSGANYGFRYTLDNGVGSGVDANTSIGTFGNSASSTFRGEVTNVASKPKLGSGRSIASNGTTRPNYVEFYYGWNNTSAQISRIDFINSGAGDFAIGSELIVLGHD